MFRRRPKQQATVLPLPGPEPEPEPEPELDPAAYLDQLPEDQKEFVLPWRESHVFPSEITPPRPPRHVFSPKPLPPATPPPQASTPLPPPPLSTPVRLFPRLTSYKSNDGAYKSLNGTLASNSPSPKPKRSFYRGAPRSLSPPPPLPSLPSPVIPSKPLPFNQGIERRVPHDRTRIDSRATVNGSPIPKQAPALSHRERVTSDLSQRSLSPTVASPPKSTFIQRVKNKASFSSLRHPAPKNEAEFIPPVPVVPGRYSNSTPVVAPRIPAPVFFKRDHPSKPKVSVETVTAPLQPNDPPAVDYLDHIDFNKTLNPEEFMELRAADPDDPTGAYHYMPWTKRAPPELDFVIPESWAVENAAALQAEELHRGSDVESFPGQWDDEPPAVGGIKLIKQEELAEEVRAERAERKRFVSEVEEEEEIVFRDAALKRPRRKRLVVGNDAEVTISGQQLWTLRIYWRHTDDYQLVKCPINTTAQELRNAVVDHWDLENNTMNVKYRIFILEKGMDRMLFKLEKPALMLKHRLKSLGYPIDNTTPKFGRVDTEFAARFVIQESAIRSMEDEQEIRLFDRGDVRLDYNNLQVIPATLHDIAPTIERLSLGHNPIQEIPRDFLEICKELNELKLVRTAFKRVPPALGDATPAALRTLDLSSNRLRDLRSGNLHKAVRLRGLKLHNNRLTTLPREYVAIEKLSSLNMSNNMLEDIPDVVWEFNKLTELDLSFNQICQVSGSGIARLTRLLHLSLAGNRLTKLPLDIATLAFLEALDIRHNAISSLAPLEGIRGLTSLRAQHNQISAVTFTLPPLLAELLLSHNPLTRFTPSQLDGLRVKPWLSILKIAFSKLATLDFDFRTVPHVKDLNLNNCSFQQLPESVTMLTQLRRLHCAAGRLTTLPESIGNLQYLEELVLYDNNLKELPQSIWECCCLRYLNASSNLLGRFPKPSKLLLDTIEETRKAGKKHLSLADSLCYLYLADNKLADEVFFSLSRLKSLNLLNLSYNVITFIPDNTIRNLRHLRSLYLSGNRLSSLNGEQLPRSQNLITLFLNSNRLIALPPEIAKYQYLTTLDVGNNRLRYNIHNWPYDYQWIWNLSLRSLNLSGNVKFQITRQPAPKSKTKAMPDPANFTYLQKVQLLGLMDITLGVTSIPSEGRNRRVRTTPTTVNGMGYGLADALGDNEPQLRNISSFDLVVPTFLSNEEECLFGLISRGLDSQSNGCARFVHDNFVRVLSRELSRNKEDRTGNVSDALTRAFLLLNKMFYDHKTPRIGRQRHALIRDNETLRSGASAVIVYVVEKTLYVANAGIAMAILSREGHAEVLTTKHEPLAPIEIARLRNTAGYVTGSNGLNGVLAASRGFGYYHQTPAIIALPDVKIHKLSSADEFLIVASPSLWKHLSYQTAVDVARDYYQNGNAIGAAEALRDLAIGFGAVEGLMVMVILLGDLCNVRRSIEAERTMKMDSFDRRAREPAISISGIERLGSAVEAPTGKVVLVFTDIQGSTSLWQKYHDAMHTAIDMHSKCFRRLLRLRGGFEVKTEGDAFMAAFSSLFAAVRWCMEAQLQLLQEDWPLEILQSKEGNEEFGEAGNLIARGIRVRMGIHQGSPLCEVDPTTGRMDYFGPMVNLSARVEGAARGGDIMMSGDAVRELRKYIAFGDPDRPSAGHPSESLILALSPEDQKHLGAITSLDPVLREVGYILLKGLEVPQMLTLIYPRVLLSRYKPYPPPVQESTKSESVLKLEPEAVLEPELEAAFDSDMGPALDPEMQSALDEWHDLTMPDPLADEDVDFDRFSRSVSTQGTIQRLDAGPEVIQDAAHVPILEAVVEPGISSESSDSDSVYESLADGASEPAAVSEAGSLDDFFPRQNALVTASTHPADFMPPMELAAALQPESDLVHARRVVDEQSAPSIPLELEDVRVLAEVCDRLETITDSAIWKEPSSFRLNMRIESIGEIRPPGAIPTPSYSSSNRPQTGPVEFYEGGIRRLMTERRPVLQASNGRLFSSNVPTDEEASKDLVLCDLVDLSQRLDAALTLLSLRYARGHAAVHANIAAA